MLKINGRCTLNRKNFCKYIVCGLLNQIFSEALSFTPSAASMITGEKEISEESHEITVTQSMCLRCKANAEEEIIEFLNIINRHHPTY